MTRDDILTNVKELEKATKKVISIKKYRRSKIVQDEIVEAFKTPVPNAITIKGKPKQVEKDNWIVLHPDGTQSTYTDEEFNKIFELIGLGDTFTGGEDE